MTVSGTPFEYCHEDYTVPREQRSASYQKYSRFGQLPVLVDDETAMSQSNAILSFLSNRTSRFNFSEYVHRQEVMEWLFWEADNIGCSVSNLRFKTKSVSNTPEDILAYFRDRAIADLDRLDNELSDKSFLVDETPSIADISICAYLYWLNDTGLDANRWLNVTSWLDRVSELPGWFHPDQMPQENRLYD